LRVILGQPIERRYETKEVKMHYSYDQALAMIGLLIALAVLVAVSGGEINMNLDTTPTYGVSYGTTTSYMYGLYGNPVDVYSYWNNGYYQTVYVYFIPGYGMYHVIVDHQMVVGWP